ncbi:lariat debranching enzyme [Pelomyxa schiedti]|nr:lariat debranching enzyme [Pelomyxa schiedti]
MSSAATNTGGINVAVVGCSHGELDLIYAEIRRQEAQRGIKIHLLLCCGDFEAVRNEYDLANLAGPTKYHTFKDFYKYYNGQATAPVMTIFVGGNHEAQNHLRELFHGGWVAPNIYFLGYSGVIRYGGLRIAGFSGIFKGYDFNKGHFEFPPYTEDHKRSAYHVRSFDLGKLSMIRQPIDIVMSHDWPYLSPYFPVATQQKNPQLCTRIKCEPLGCQYYTDLLLSLKPRFWLSGHMHIPFTTPLSLPLPSPEGHFFVAMDKALPGHQFMDVITFPDKTGPLTLEYDPEWLAIVRGATPFSFSGNYANFQTYSPTIVASIPTHMNFVLGSLKDLTVPCNFSQTALGYKGSMRFTSYKTPFDFPGERYADSPQTEQFLSMLQIPTATSPVNNSITSNTPPPPLAQPQTSLPPPSSYSYYNNPQPQTQQYRQASNFHPMSQQQLAMQSTTTSYSYNNRGRGRGRGSTRRY